MSQPIINVADLAKRYIIGHRRDKNEGLRHVLERAFRSPAECLRLMRDRRSATKEEFWALRDVNFKVDPGEVVGIIGRNGAGKSTLLKILSRITEPTHGRITLDGRVASLLEVGTGFHPELTGRENVFLNGAILGMSRSEIKAKFDEIVAFAEVEKFLDTPVKRYSSGMYVRLAFAVAAHLEPEILIVDEVLAVGDSVFQKKCIDRMTEASKTGRTILFVTHNLAALRALCHRAIVLKGGTTAFDGTVDEGIRHYQHTALLGATSVDLSKMQRTAGPFKLAFDRIVFDKVPLPFGEPIKFSLHLRSAEPGTFPELDFGINFSDKHGTCLIHCSNRFTDTRISHDNDTCAYTVEIDNFLKPDIYYLTLFLRSKSTILDWMTDVISVEIADGNPYGYYRTSEIQGATLPRFAIRQQPQPGSGSPAIGAS